MWVARCYHGNCEFEETSSEIYDKYWNEEDEEECNCPECGEALDIERW